jgi:hypothetical protein
MIFGLLFGTFLTLVLVPVLYLLVAKLKERWFARTTTTPETSARPDMPGILDANV